jgi:crotonobetainyl-CoA:carnitine CoA-transferase CaiB-like acyl-CoA transferase
MSMPAKPLQGIRVLELGSTIAGPFCARLLADFGAEVIKVEDPKGDVLRDFGSKYNGRSVYAASLLRNKRFIAIDLRTTEGRQLVAELARHCDVVVENFRPGTLEKWSLGYDELARLRPDIILARISGFGQSGPYAGRPGYGIISEAKSGLRSITGDPDRPPARVAMPLTDYLTGLYAALGILMAIIERNVSGKGQVIDAALNESAMSLMESFVPAFSKFGEVPCRQGPKMSGAVPNNLYRTADGEFVHIAAWADSIFRRCCVALGQPQLADDPRFATLPARVENEAALEKVLTDWVGNHPLTEVVAALDAQDVPASKIYNVADLFTDPQLQFRQAIQRIESADFGSGLDVVAPIPRLSRTPGQVAHLGFDVGTDTRALLGDLLGYPSDRIDAMIARGVLRSGDEGKRPETDVAE